MTNVSGARFPGAPGVAVQVYGLVRAPDQTAAEEGSHEDEAVQFLERRTGQVQLVQEPMNIQEWRR